MGNTIMVTSSRKSCALPAFTIAAAAMVLLSPVKATAQETEVSLALNYTLGSSHGGIVAAEQLGYFKEAGLKVTVLPWSSQTRAETLVSSGQADLAVVASSDDAIVNFAAGRPIVAVAAFEQHDPALIGVKADGDIKRPRDLDGKTYGGFGSAKEPLLVKALITGDGGKGDFRNVTLGTAAYEALYTGQVDAALFWRYSDAVEAQMRGRDIKYFAFSDYGLPDQYATIIVVNKDYLTGHEDAVRKLLAALVKGYEYQLAHPEDVTKMLTTAGSTADPVFLNRSIEDFNKTLKSSDGKIGPMSLDVWKTRTSFWIDGGFLVDEAGQNITQPLSFDDVVTNDYLPQ